MSVAKLTAKGQITIPKSVRQFLHLSIGDQLEFVPEKSGRVYICPRTIKAKDLVGLRGNAKRHFTEEDMDKAIVQKLKEKFAHESD